MKLSHKLLLAVILIILIFAAMDLAGAFSIREFFGMANTEKQGQDTVSQDGSTAHKQNWAQPSTSLADQGLSLQDVESIFANLQANQRQAYLENDESFRNTIGQEAASRSLLEAARVNKVDQDKNVQFLMQRAADTVLRQSYVNRLISEKLPEEFPTEQQLIEYYEKNKEKFVVAERVQLWQIFLKTDESMDDKAITALMNKAEKINADIKQGIVDFSTAALQYSEHGPSRQNGGNMGLIKVMELIPEISASVLALKENTISIPTRSNTGIHILKRGPIVPAQEVSFEQIKPQLQELVKKQAIAQLNQAIVEQAIKSYPIEIEVKKLEEWRIRLRAGLHSPKEETQK